MNDPRPDDQPSNVLSNTPGDGELDLPAEQVEPMSDDASTNGLDGQTPSGDDLRIVDDLDRVKLFGLDLVNASSLEPVVDEILTGPRRDDEVLPVVLTPNVDILVHLDQAQPDAPEVDLFRRAQFCLPDGQPIVAVSRFLRHRLGARLPGSELFERLWPRIVADDVPVIVVASNDLIAQRLEEQHTTGSYIVPPMFDADDDDAIADVVSDILSAVRATRPNLILVGIGNPKDARIISALFHRWETKLGPKPLCLGLGGSFLMQLGMKKRAPSWIQKIGMEWFYRFLQEPRRLFHRYFVRDTAFLGIAYREWRTTKANR